MPKRKAEDKRVRYESPDQKRQVHIRNEKGIEKCFYNCAGYWGIDKLVLDVNIRKISKGKLLSRRSDFCTVELKPNRDDSSKDIFNIYDKIVIYDSKIGRLSIVHDRANPFVKFARLELFHTGINVETGCIKDIWQRFYKVVKRFKSFYGITIDCNPMVCLIELCFTFACNSIIPLPVRKYIISAFAESATVDARHYTGTSTKDDLHLITAGRCESNKDVFYDKTGKSEHLNQISKLIEHLIRVYRVEFCIGKDKLKNDKDLRSTLLSNLPNDKKIQHIYLSDFKEENIISYLSMRVAKAIDYYRFNIIKTSLKSVRRTLSEARSMDPIHYNTKYDGLIAKHQAEHDVSPIIDDESIIFANLKNIFTNSNISKNRRVLLFSETSSESPKRRMYGWEVERIFAFMIKCLKNGLGVKEKDRTESPKTYVVANGQYNKNDKNNYLIALFSGTKKYKRICYVDLILDRITNQWNHENINIPPIGSLTEMYSNKKPPF